MKKSTLLAAASALALSVAMSNVALADDPLIDDSLNNNDLNIADDGGTNVNDSLNNNDLFSHNTKTEVDAEKGGVAAGDDAYNTEIEIEKKVIKNSFNDTFTKTYNTAIAVDASRDGNILMANKVELKAVVAGIKLMPIADGYAKNSPEAKNFAENEAKNETDDVKSGVYGKQEVDQDSEQKAANLGLNIGLALNKNEADEAENKAIQLGKSESDEADNDLKQFGKNDVEDEDGKGWQKNDAGQVAVSDSEQKNDADQVAVSSANQDNDTGNQDQSNDQESDQRNSGDQTQKAYANSDQDADVDNTQVAVADGKASNVSVAKLFLTTGDIGGRWHNIRGITNVTLNTGFGAQNAVTNVNAMIGSVNGSGRITSGQ